MFNLNSNKKTPFRKVDIKYQEYSNKLEFFLEKFKQSGGEIIDNLEELLKNQEVLSIYNEFNFKTINPNSFDSPFEIAKFKYAIIKAKFAVAENGSCYIQEDNNIHRAIYSLVENLIIILDKNSILNNMHEAYDNIDPSFKYGIFISGPSKTADIEQTLVIGAHGAKRVYLKLK